MTRPFVTVILRTRGDRPLNFAEALECLGRQTERDFEVVVVAHPGSEPAAREALRGQPRRVSTRARLVPAPPGGRTPPLNAGLDVARGRYVTFLDDDDLVTEDWIDAFRAGATAAPGLVIRNGALTQRVRREADGTYTRIGNPFSEFGGVEFDIVDHLVDNRSPNFSWAVPLDRVRAEGIRFDESLPVLEDWDFLVRCALAFGVHSTGRVTGSYHRWETGESSLDDHGADEWATTRSRIHERFDALLDRPRLVSGLAEREAALAATVAVSERSPG